MPVFNFFLDAMSKDHNIFTFRYPAFTRLSVQTSNLAINFSLRGKKSLFNLFKKSGIGQKCITELYILNKRNKATRKKIILE